MSIGENLERIKSTLPENVTLVAVSKTKPNEDIMEAYETGHRDFGENKVQDLTAKAAELPEDIRWHMIGHVQTNKIKYFAPFVHLVHGVDREKVLKELNKEARKNERIIDCLLQVHIAREQTKFGFDADEIHALFEKDLPVLYPNVRIRGLMGMATFTEDQDQVRSEFQIFEDSYSIRFNQQFIHSAFSIQHSLSMGMTGDYKIAIEEGSTMVRIGTAIFGARNY